MALLLSVILPVMQDEEESFWCLIAVIEDILPGYFRGSHGSLEDARQRVRVSK